MFQGRFVRLSARSLPPFPEWRCVMNVLVETLPAPATTAGRRSRGWLLAALGLWCLLAGAGLYAVNRYQSIAGEPGDPPAAWPGDSSITRNGRPALLLFAHPRCPCTRASLAELSRLVAECGDRVDAHVVIIMPEAVQDSWNESDSLPQDMPRITTHRDVGRRESRLFGARTSGMCLLYDAEGRLLYRGGLTTARGQEGPGPGSDSIRSLVLGTKARAADGEPVYGCPLFERSAESPGRDAD